MSLLDGISLWHEAGKTKDAFLELREYVLALENRIECLEEHDKKLVEEVKSDIHEHVRALVAQTKELEMELKDLKSRIRFPID